MGEQNVLDGYAVDAPRLISQFEAISSTDVLAPVIDLLPAEPCRILEIGAGTGRDAAWLADQGHQIVAVEPVHELRSAGMALHPSRNITWVDDHLPDLTGLRSRREMYDFILLVAVWQHLRPEHHSHAISILAEMTARNGRLVMSLRHGPGSSTRPCFPAHLEEIVSAADDAGLSLALCRPAPSVQKRNRDAGVTWSWLCLDRR